MKLICLACSATKKPGDGMMPAHDRYDGPMWRSLRVALRGVAEKPELWFLSARYGFQKARAPIPDYDTRAAGSMFPPGNEDGFERACLASDAVLFAGGEMYRAVMYRAVGQLDTVTETDGPGIGHQRAQLRAWIAENCR